MNTFFGYKQDYDKINHLHSKSQVYMNNEFFEDQYI